MPKSKHIQVPPIDDAPLEGGFYDSEEVPGPEPRMKPGPHSKFTEDRIQRIIDDIRGGAFAHVAARANGISVATLARWRLNPCDHKCKDPCIDLLHKARHEFSDAVASAEAQARVDAEKRVHTAKPAVWLRLGPGRDHGDPSKPGWTNPIKRVEGKHAHAHVHLNADDRPRVAIDLSRLSKAEVVQLEELTRKLMPDGVNKAAIEVSASDD